MSSAGRISGALVQYDIPRWEPLYDLVGVDLADWFMWMCEIAEDGRVFAYTRGGCYTEIHPRHAIDAVFDGWEQLRPEPEDPAAVRDALRRARKAAATVASSREEG
jgi:hypothetical protein